MNTMTIKAALLTLPLSLSAAVQAADYKITITNLTHAQSFTPALVVSHKRGQPVFSPGHAASTELEAAAEGGDTGPLTAMLESSENTWDIASSDGLLAPGGSVTIDLNAKGNFRYVSLVSMLIPTNDAFIGLSGIRLPKKAGKPEMLMVPAYDAGTELNDESCDHIPGPVCGGEGVSDDGGEGFVSVHRGIHGIADLPAETYDWRSPTARITIEKM
jgi:hypothetical protein